METTAPQHAMKLALPQGVDEEGNKQDNIMLEILETLASIWFTAEYFLRLAGSPAKLNFLKNSANGLDLLAVLPFYVPLVIMLMESEAAPPALGPQRASWQTPARSGMSLLDA